MKILQIVDDGTLDTLLKCPECGKIDRYTDIDREDPSWLEDYSNEHFMLCEARDTIDHEYYAQWEE